MKCEHDLSERETACADGMCPICLTAENERLRAALANLADAYYRNCDSGPDERYSPQEDREYRDALVLLNQQLGGKE